MNNVNDFPVADVSRMVCAGFSNAMILQALSETHGVVLSLSTLKRRMKNAEIVRQPKDALIDYWIEDARDMVTNNVSAKKIVMWLKTRHEVDMSEKTLRRILIEHGISWRAPSVTFADAVTYVAEIIELNNGQLGFRTMTQRIRLSYGLNISRELVEEALRYYDPAGLRERTRTGLRRRDYANRGPNDAWHYDGYDKLSPYGLSIHGCTDGFSRKIIWLHVAITNRLKRVVLFYFLQSISKLNGLPCMTRSDFGTENIATSTAQIAAYGLDDAHIFGKSTMNTRIEGAWLQLRKRCTDYWIDYFKKLVDDGIFLLNDWMYKTCSFVVFGPLIDAEVKMHQRVWNSHKMRADPAHNFAGGVPDEMYRTPEYYAAKDQLPGVECKKELPDGFLEQCVAHLDPLDPAEIFSDALLNTCFNHLHRQRLYPVTMNNKTEAFISLVEHLSAMPADEFAEDSDFSDFD